MTLTLEKNTNGHSLTLPDSLVEAFGVDEHTPLEVELVGDALRVSRVEAEGDGEGETGGSRQGFTREEMAESIAWLRQNYGQMLRNLAEGPK